MISPNIIRNEDGVVLKQRPPDHSNTADMLPAPKSGTFNSPHTQGPDNCLDIQSRNGQSFELIAEIWSDDLIDLPPQALIRFPDGLEIVAWEEEIGWGECFVGGKPWPPQLPTAD